MSEAPAPKKRLGDLLVERELISSDQLRIALQEQKSSGKPLGEALLALGFITEDGLRIALSDNLGHQSINLVGIVGDPKALALVPKQIARRHTLFPVSLTPNGAKLIIACPDPNDIIATDQVRTLLGKNGPEPIWRLASSAEILAAIEQFYEHELSIDGILQELETGDVDMASLAQGTGAYSHPIVRLVDALLADAVLRGASDLHFEPEAQFIRIRYRIDGVLKQIRSLHQRFLAAMVVRLKVMSQMNIAESRSPQDGRISLTIFGRRVDFRSAVQPTIHGENFVLRVLDHKRGIVPIDKLGLTAHQDTTLKLMLARPEGILLVTGPTGSGKTTTLYSMLGHMNSPEVNIMTLEDPVEYPMPLVRQTSVAEASKIDFAEGIRSLMRQDPDIILVGEVRDRDTAEMALRAAMTGHQVFSTLHTNSAIRSIPRLLDLGIEPDILAGNIIGIVAQRLLRKLCTQCRTPYPASEFEAILLGVDPDRPPEIFSAKGCPACDNSGYKGRVSIIELLKFDAGLDELVARRASIKEMTEYAQSKGFVNIAEDGIRRVLEGTTTLEEVSRVVDLTDRIIN